MTMNAALTLSNVAIRGLRKRYGQTVALDGLDLEATGGRIIGIAGPNGAGKSTMVKIIAGETPADSGEMIVDGAPWTPSVGARAVAVVHQEPQLFANLTVGENLRVGREGFLVGRPAVTENERALLRRFGIEALADRRLGALPLAAQQRVEIVRALAQDARVFLFDEPNSALTAEESASLFATMHDLAEAGHVVFLVSHRLVELAEHASEVVVILDGRASATLSGAGLDEESLARAITVSTNRASSERRRAATETVALRLHEWTHPAGVFSGIELEARTGEVLAIVGVEGSGGREFVQSLAGFEPAAGRLVVEGTQRTTGYVPPDRRAALFFNFSVGENLVTRLDREIRGTAGLRSRSRSRKAAQTMVDRMGVKASGLGSWVGALSGGNQQKVLIGSAIAPKPGILVLEEPTRGVDVGSKREIYGHLHDYAAEGAVVIIFCTEIPEVFEVADRAHVMAGGRLSAAIDIAAQGDEKALAATVARLEREMRDARRHIT